MHYVCISSFSCIVSVDSTTTSSVAPSDVSTTQVISTDSGSGDGAVPLAPIPLATMPEKTNTLPFAPLIQATPPTQPASMILQRQTYGSSAAPPSPFGITETPRRRVSGIMFRKDYNTPK